MMIGLVVIAVVVFVVVLIDRHENVLYHTKNFRIVLKGDFRLEERHGFVWVEVARSASFLSLKDILNGRS